MISAVVPPQPLPQPPAPVLAAGAVRQMAAAGYFRAIALWLNHPLAQQGIFVQVQADRPGCLRLLVEFEQPPMKERLLRLLCHRIWLLNSELIEGIHVVARPRGRARVLWQQRIKIVTPALKRQKAVAPMIYAPQPGSPLPPQIHHRPPRAWALSGQRLKALRAFVLTGSAVAAFIFGCLLEVITAGPSPMLPSFTGRANGVTPGAELSGFRPPALASRGENARAGALVGSDSGAEVSPRPTVVDAALEPVGVVSYPKPTPAPPDEVTLLFGGDISLDHLDYDHLEAEGGFFSEVNDYAQADVSMVNLATPLATAATNLEEELRHRTRTDAVNLLVDSGVDIVNLTNGGLMQYGAEGLSETLTTLDSKGLYRVGAGRNATEARRPEILDVKGKRIAYLSYAMGGKDAAIDTTNLKERAGSRDQSVIKELESFKTASAFKDRAGFNAQTMPDIVADIQALRSEVDWIVVNFRWVDYIAEEPNFAQTNLARLAIDQGADVVVGYHPTVIQGGEIYKGRPIAYSLGDFVFKNDQPVENQDSAMLKVSLKDDQMQVEFVPVRVRDSRPKTLTGEAGEAVLNRIAESSAQFGRPMTSPMVLDLKAPEPPAAAPVDPNSPFLSPDGVDTRPTPSPEPPAAEPPSEPDLEDAGTSSPQSGGTSPSPGEEIPMEPSLEDLKDWGTKPSSQQKEFQPIPQNRSGAATGSLDTLLQRSLRPQSRLPVSHSVPPSAAVGPASSTQADPWADALPAVPTPDPEALLPAPTAISTPTIPLDTGSSSHQRPDGAAGSGNESALSPRAAQDEAGSVLTAQVADDKADLGQGESGN